MVVVAQPAEAVSLRIRTRLDTEWPNELRRIPALPASSKRQPVIARMASAVVELDRRTVQRCSRITRCVAPEISSIPIHPALGRDRRVDSRLKQLTIERILVDPTKSAIH